MSQPGFYSVVATNEAGCAYESGPYFQFFLEVEQPQLEIQTEGNYCIGGYLDITASEGYDQYDWYLFGEVIVSGGDNSFSIALNDGFIGAELQLEVTTSNGCSAFSEVLEIDLSEIDLPNIINLGGAELCAGQTSTLTIVGNYETIQWFQNGESISGANEPSIEVNSTGAYSVFVDDGNGCAGTSDPVEIFVSEPAVPEIVGAAGFCEGESSVLSVPAGYLLYDWYLEGLLIQSGYLPTVTANEPGFYTVNVETVDGCLGFSEVFNLVETSAPTPVLTFESEGSFCEGAMVTMSVQNGFASYDWYLNGDLAITGGDAAYEFQLTDLAMNSSVMVVVTDENGCSGSTGPSMVPVGGESAPIIIADGDSEICQGETLMLAVPGSYTSVQWFYNGTAVPTGVSPSFEAQLAGTYAVFVDDGAGCSGTSEDYIVQVNTPEAPVISGDDFTLCGTDQAVLLNATEGYTNYIWLRNGNTVAQNGPSNTIEVYQPGDYAVLATDLNGCEVLSLGVTIVLNEIPYLDAGSDMLVCTGTTLNLDINSTAPIVVTLLNGNEDAMPSCMDCHDPEITLTSAATYQVVATATNGCTSIDQITINVADAPVPSISAQTSEPFCEGDEVILETSGGFANYTWIRDGLVVEQNSDLNYLVASVAGSYTVTSGNGADCEGTSEPFVLDFLPAPTVSLDIEGSGNFCEDNVVTLSAEEGFANYTWNYNGNLFTTGTQNSFPLGLIDIGEPLLFSVEVEDENGCIGNSAVVEVPVWTDASPQILANGPTTICDGESVSLILIGEYESIQWLLDGEEIADANSNIIFADEAGAYTVTADDGVDCSGTSEPITITLGDAPQVEILGEDFNLCGEGSDQLLLTATEGLSNYTWYRGGVLLLQDGPSNEFQATVTGIYSVVGSNESGCESSSEAVEVVLGSAPPLNLSVEKYEICPGETVDMSVNSSAATISWGPDNGTLNCLDCPVAIASPIETTTYSVLIAAENGCSVSSEITIEVLEELSVEVFAETTYVCPNGLTTLYATEGYDQYNWIRDGLTLVQSSDVPLLVVDQAGVYTVEVSNAAGCEGESNPTDILVAEFPEVAINSQTGFEGCPGEILLEAPTGEFDYQWFIDEEAVPGATQSTFIPMFTGEYSVSLTFPGTLCTEFSNLYLVDFGEAVQGYIDISASPICTGDLVTVEFIGQYDFNSSFNWDFGSAAVLSGEGAGPYVISYNNTGSYSIAVETQSINCFNVYTADAEVGSFAGTAQLLAIDITDCENFNGAIGLSIFGSDISILWDGPNGFTSTEENLFDIGPGTYVATLTDANGCMIEVQATLELPDEGDGVIAINDGTSTNNGVPVTIAVLENDLGENFVISQIVEEPESGEALINDDGTITYLPEPGFIGNDVFIYQIVDNLCNHSQATVSILVTAAFINSPPIEIVDTICTNIATPITVCPDLIDIDGQAVTITNLSAEFGNLVEAVENNCFYFEPAADFEGTEVISITVCDDFDPPACSNSTFYIPVGSTETIANPDVITISGSEYTVNSDIGFGEETLDSLWINVLANDVGACELTEVGALDHGVALISQNGIAFQPEIGWYGTTSFSYTTCCDCSCDETLVTVNVEEPVEEEFCCNYLGACSEPGGSVIFCPKFCDFAEDDVVTITDIQVEVPTEISVISSLGCIEYNSPPGFTGNETMEVVGCNQDGLCETTFVFISVSSCFGLEAVDDYLTTTVDTPISFNPLSNDIGGVIEVESCEDGAHGTVTANSDGLIYTPDPGFIGEDQFDCVICNQAGECDTSTTYVTITSDCTYEDQYCTAALTPLEICPEFCDIGDDYSIDAVLNAVNCGITILENNCVEYVPLPAVYGLDSITVIGCNPLGICDAQTYYIDVGCGGPSAVDDSAAAETGELVAIDVLDNDTSNCTEGTEITIVSGPTNGTAYVNQFNLVIYTSNDGFIGNDQIIYNLCNDCTEQCATAVVNINVVSPSITIVAVDDEVFTLVDESVIVKVLTNDLPPAGVEASIVDWTPPTNGIVTRINNEFQYTPNQQYVGSDEYSYEVCASGICQIGIVRIEVINSVLAQDDHYTILPNLPIELDITDNDLGPFGQISITGDPQNGNVQIDENGNLVYTPNADFTGQDMLQYTVCDEFTGLDCSIGTVYITVQDTDIVTVSAEDDLASTFIGTAIELHVLSNDNYDGNSLQIIIMDEPENGQVLVDEDGVIEYTPNPEFLGEDAFTYQLCLNDICDIAVVAIIVQSAGEPEAEDDYIVVEQDASQIIDLLENDTETNGLNLYLTSIESPENGVVEQLTSGEISYTPFPGYFGSDAFSYTVCNQFGECSQALVFVEVKKMECQALIPKGLSPNGDGIGDFLEISDADCYDNIELQIFNRWGVKVFESNSYDNTWNGYWLKSNEPLPDGTYFYLLQFSKAEQRFDRAGYIVLHR